jgi:hypothetical protein
MITPSLIVFTIAKVYMGVALFTCIDQLIRELKNKKNEYRN